MRRATTVLTSAAAVALLAACGTDGGDHPISARTTSETTTSQEPTTATPTTGTPAFPGKTARQTAEYVGEWDLVFTGIRVAEHEGFDRIVLEFTGTGIPGWVVNYVDEAALDGSGRVVRLGGDAVLDVYATGTTWPGPDYDSGPRWLEAESGGVTDVHVGGTLEAYTQVLAGIDGDPVPFRVFALTDPSRLVVDVVGESAD